MAKLHFKYGTMNSGKSICLMQTAYNYEEVGYSTLVLKPKIDIKGNDYLSSRIGLKRRVDYLIDDDTDVINIVKRCKKKNLACILVDEAQFLSAKVIDDLFIITKTLDVPVICYGLRNNFKMEGFEGSIRLLEIADELEEIKTMCNCGKVARYVGRKVNNRFVCDGDLILIDGALSNVEYVPMCGKCYLKRVKNIK